MNNINENKSDGLAQSLNLLKQLQNKLHKPTQRHHIRNKTQKYQPNSPTLNPFQNSQRKTYSPHSALNVKPIYDLNQANKKRINKNVSSSIPLMHQENQNQYDTIRQVLRQNRKLKKYVNCLLQMNDYLKNQLIQKSQWEFKRNPQGKQMGNSVEMDLMRMEIQYLKQMNRQKQIDLKRSIYLAQKMQSTPKSNKKNKKSSKKYSQYDHTCHKNHSNNIGIHHRSFSGIDSNCQAKTSKIYPIDDTNLFMKDVLKSKLTKRPKQTHNQLTNSKCNCRNSSKFNKNKKSLKYSKKQCRLCYI